MVAISVLMYIYNAENFLKDSLDSLLNQSFKDVEIFCINDGSTDKSSEILKQYNNKKNINIISSKHSGYSQSINKTLQKVRGKYFYILTPGCVLKENALKSLYNKSEELKTDLTVTNSEYFDEINNKYFEKNENFNNQFNLNSNKIIIYEDIKELIFEMDTNISNILFNKTFIKTNKISFPESVSYGDEILFYKSLLSAKKMYIIKDTLLTHRTYYTSLTKRYDSHLLDNILISKDIIELFKENKELDNCKNVIYEHEMNYIMDSYYKIKEEYKEEYYIKLKQYFLDILNDEKMCKDFTENISDNNRKLFEQVLISDNIYEFELLRKTYNKMNEYYQALIERKFLKPLVTENDE